MRIFPDKQNGWVNLMLLAFRGYGVIAFFLSIVWEHEIRQADDEAFLWMLAGYVICFFALATIDTVLIFMRRPGEPRQTWLWTIITFVLTVVFAWRFLPELAK